MHHCKAWHGGMALDETFQPIDVGQTCHAQKPFHSKAISFDFPSVPLVPLVPLVSDFSPQ